MRLIPVLDVMNGVVVRGVGGRRSEYRPIVSKLTSSTDPVVVARTLVESFHPRELYLADLDALQGGRAAADTYRAICGLGVRVWVDAGVRDAGGAGVVADAGCDVVAGLETVPGPATLGSIVRAVGEDRVVFSLDLKDGEPLREWVNGERPCVSRPSGRDARGGLAPGARGATRPADAWPFAIAGAAVDVGVRRLIVLDLARVGGGAGTGTDELCRQIVESYPQVEVIAGGGVAGPGDLKRLEACGVRGVLVASALHDGRIKPVLSLEC